MEIKQNKFGKYQCPCCGFFTFIDKPVNTFQDCPVCLWEIDGIQFDDPYYEGGANSVSLDAARKNFKNFGAVEMNFIEQVRPPRKEEMDT